MVNKELVKKRFEKNIETYPDNAVVQKQIAKNLVSNLIKLKGSRYDRIFEIGCGAGLLTKNIVKDIEFSEFFSNDITNAAQRKMKKISDCINFIGGDCEAIAMPKDLDLIISNSTFQWVNNLEQLLDKIALCLNKNGVLAFTTFGAENFYQIKNITGKSLNYCSKETIEALLEKDFEIIYSSNKLIELEFDSAEDILRHMKLSGVNSLESTSWTKNDLKHFLKEYNKSYTNEKGKLTLTYNPISEIAILKDNI